MANAVECVTCVSGRDCQCGEHTDFLRVSVMRRVSPRPHITPQGGIVYIYITPQGGIVLLTNPPHLRRNTTPLHQNVQLTGPLPYELKELKQLQALSLNDNQLTGTLPEWLGTFRDLKMLSLRNNELQVC